MHEQALLSFLETNDHLHQDERSTNEVAMDRSASQI
jgi:hypothetical protein